VKRLDRLEQLYLAVSEELADLQARIVERLGELKKP
jgi:hypothetical protein